MIEACARYAVYYAPPPHSGLAVAGAAWLGHDPERGTPAATLEVAGLPAPREALVRRPRRYGLHATLKAPFRLPEGVPPQALHEALTALAAARRPVTAPPLRVDADMGFVALRLSAPSAEVDALAAACVTELDPLRAPLTGEELAERRRGGLDPQEEANLRSWGYPHVLGAFRFHITLTGPLARAEAAQAADALAAALAPALPPVFVLGALCLFGDPGEGAPFRLLRRYPLTGR